MNFNYSRVLLEAPIYGKLSISQSSKLIKGYVLCIYYPPGFKVGFILLTLNNILFVHLRYSGISFFLPYYSVKVFYSLKRGVCAIKSNLEIYLGRV